MNYKEEIKRMKHHRKKFFPVLERMLMLYRQTTEDELPVELTDDKDILIILELLDIEYLDKEAFIIKKPFGTVEEVLYNGSEPLTDAGEFMLKSSRYQGVKKYLFFIAIGVFVLIKVLSTTKC